MTNEEIFMDECLIELDGISNEQKNWSQYEFEGRPVPRVSHILKQCQDMDWLIKWTAAIGKNKADYYTEKALNIGTIVHDIVETYLANKYPVKTNNMVQSFNASISPFEVLYENIEPEYRSSVYNCFENFKLWEKRLESYGCRIEEVYGFELPIVTPWYGGTIDGIVKINGVWYIIDFKTSKEISPSYILQTCAYMWGVNDSWGYPHISGVGIIRLDKKSVGVIDDLFLNEFDNHQFDIITKAQLCFGSYVNAYYRTKSIEYMVPKYHNKEYNPKEVYAS